MYNTQKMIETGRAIMRDNPNRDIKVYELKAAKEQAGDDEYLFAENTFLFGVAVGMRIATRGGAKKS